MVPSSDKIAAGRRFASDLRRIRELRGISADAVIARTKASPDVLESFEKNALVDHPMYNRVYLRSFVRTYADAVDIDTEVALAAADELLAGRYRGSLGVRFLGDDPGDADQAAAPPDDPEEAPDVGVDVMHAFESAPPDPVRTWIGRLKWIVPGVIVLVIALLLLLGGSPDDSQPQEDIPPPVESVPPPAEQAVEEISVPVAPPRVVLPDTMQIWIVAERDTLNPVRVRIDDDRRRPYWIEVGDSLVFPVLSSITIEQRMEDLALNVEGFRLPTSGFGVGEPIVFDREQIQAILDSLRMTR